MSVERFELSTYGLKSPFQYKGPTLTTSFYSLIIIKATTRRIAGEIHIVPMPNFSDSIPPIPAPMAKIKIIPKKCKALYNVPFSFVLKYCDKLSVPLLRLPIHIVLAYPYP